MGEQMGQEMGRIARLALDEMVIPLVLPGELHLATRSVTEALPDQPDGVTGLPFHLDAELLDGSAGFLVLHFRQRTLDLPI